MHDGMIEVLVPMMEFLEDISGRPCGALPEKTEKYATAFAPQVVEAFLTLFPSIREVYLTTQLVLERGKALTSGWVDILGRQLTVWH